MKKAINTIFILLFSTGVFCQPLSVKVENNASFEHSNYLINEAGEDFPSNIVSESTVEISVTYNNFWDKIFNPNGKWRINVQKSDIQWDQNLTLQIKRTGNGFKTNNKKANVKDGKSYQAVTNTPYYFFRGKAEVSYIPVLLRIQGLSVTMGAQDFETNLILTVYDDW